MQHLRAINLIVLLSALLCSAQAVTAESAKTTPQFIKGAVKPIATKNLVAPILRQKEANSEKKATQVKAVPKAIPKVVPKAAFKVIPQPAKKSSQPPGVVTKMPKPAAKPAVAAKVKVGSSLLKQAAPPNRKPQPNTIIKGIPGITGKSQMGVSKKAVAPVGAVKPANPASSSGGFQGLAKSREKVQQPVKLLQTGPADGLRVPISGGGAHLAPGVQLPDDAQAQPRMQGIPPPELREGLVPARENLRADLQIFEIKRITSGRDRGKISISVKAIPEVAGNQAPLESFPIRLWMGGIGSTLLWEGRGQIKNILGVFADQVVTSHVLDSRPVTLTAEVNVSNMDSLYPESCPREAGCNRSNSDIDNRYSRDFNINTPASAPVREATGEVQEVAPRITSANALVTRVTDVRVVRRGPDWAIIGITYDLQERHTEEGDWYRFYVRPGTAGVPGETSLSHTEESDRILCSPEGRLRSRLPLSGREAWPGHLLSTGQGGYIEARCQLQSGAGAFRSIITASINVWQSRDNYLSRGWKRTPLLWWGHDDVPLVWDQDSLLSPDYVIDSALIQRGAAEKPVALRIAARNIGSNLNRPVSIKVEFINQIDGVVATHHYEMSISTRGVSELLVSLAGMDDFEWRSDDYRYGTGTILVTLNSRRNIVESSYENNRRRFEVVDYAPRHR